MEIHSVLTAIMTFLRSARDVLLRSRRVLLHANGVLMMRSRRARSCHCASTAWTLHGWRSKNVDDVSARSVGMQTPSSEKEHMGQWTP